MKRNIITGALTLALCCVFSGTVKADNIHLCDVSTGCTSSSVILISGSTTSAYVSGNPTDDALFLAILNPVTDLSGNWNNNKTTLWSVLGVSGGTVFPNLNSAISQESGATGISAMSFNVSDLNIGTWTSSPQKVTLPGSEPTGTIFMAFTEDSNGSLELVTPWSSSLITTSSGGGGGTGGGTGGGGGTSVPEPSVALLLGVGLIGVVALKRVIV